MSVTVPIIDKNAHKRVFNPEDLYGLGGRFLPNPKDWIVDETEKTIRVVVLVDYALYEYTTEPWNPSETGDNDIILGINNFLSPLMYKFYVDESKSPPTLSMDSRVAFSPGSDSIRVFLGTDVSDEGECISGYMKGGELISTSIPLISADGLRFPVDGVVTRPILDDKALLTFVVYNDASRITITERAQLIKTANMSKLETASRVVKNVSLDSPWLESPSSNLLRLPTNISIDDIAMKVKVEYSDRVESFPLDNDRAKLVGLKSSGAYDPVYISSNVGKEIPLVFSYRLSKDELYVGPDLSEDTIVKEYRGVPEAVDGAYSLKLFVVPTWMGEATGWRLRYFLYDLRRGVPYEATDAVRAAPNSAVFDPHLYNTKQKIVVSVNTKDVSSSYKDHTFPQSFYITLLNEGDNPGSNFKLGYLPNTAEYGDGVVGKFDYDNVSYTTVKVDCGAESLTEWLELLYDKVYPLYDRKMETKPLTPTHFIVTIDDLSITLPISDWFKGVVFEKNIKPGTTATIRWINKQPKDDLELGMSSMLLYPEVVL